MYCSVYALGGISAQTCKNAIIDGVEACVLCDGHGRESYPDPMPDCGCGRATSHSGTCAERQSFFDAHRTPTEAEKSFIALLLKGRSPVVALEMSDLATTTNPDKKVERLMQMPHIRRYLGDILESVGATDRKIASVVAAGLDAGDTQIRMEKTVAEGVTTEKAVKIERPDWQARGRFVEIALRMKGYLEKDDGSKRTPTKVTIVNKYSRKGEPDEQGVQVEVG